MTVLLSSVLNYANSLFVECYILTDSTSTTLDINKTDLQLSVKNKLNKISLYKCNLLVNLFFQLDSILNFRNLSLLTVCRFVRKLFLGCLLKPFLYPFFAPCSLNMSFIFLSPCEVDPEFKTFYGVMIKTSTSAGFPLLMTMSRSSPGPI